MSLPASFPRPSIQDSAPAFSLLCWRSPVRPGSQRVRTLLALRGRVDADAAPALERLGERLGLQAGPLTVVCSRVASMDTAGLLAVLALCSAEHPPRLCAISDAVEAVLATNAHALPTGTIITGPRRRVDLGVAARIRLV